MQELRSFAEVNRVLARFVPPPLESGNTLILDRMRELMNFLGNPQEKYKVIHVAGTSGKTSTCYYMAALLAQAGKKVGHTVSPHIDEVNERLQINLKPLSEAIYVKEFSEFLPLVEKSGVKPTYFELLVAFAYWEFAKQKVDYAVIEVGLGGNYDATNVIERADKISVITDIGLDHVDILGHDLPTITAEKAGIIQENNSVFVHKQSDEITDVIKRKCKAKKARLEILKDIGSSLQFDLPGYQSRNLSIAYQVYEFMVKRDGLPEHSDAKLAEVARTYIPGRMEIVKLKNKTIIMDGAHNDQKMTALAESIVEKFPAQPIATMMALVRSKDFKIRTNIPALLEISSYLIATEFTKEQDMRRGCVDPDEIAGYCHEQGFYEVEVIQDADVALAELLKRPENVLLITGSFFLLNNIRAKLKLTGKTQMIKAIVAIDEKRGMADDNDIPWDLPTDKKYFREMTASSPMLMGYGTYVKFKQPLPNRRNLVATKTGTELRDGFELVTDAREYLESVQEDVWVIGGPGLLETTLDLIEELYITQLKGDFSCTKFLPEYKAAFALAEAGQWQKENGTTFRFEVWKRRTKKG